MDTSIPVVDMSLYLAQADADGVVHGKVKGEVLDLCEQVANSLHEYGLVCIRDPRLDPSINEEFLTQMETYYGLPVEEKEKDERKEFHYQVGVTPEHTEHPRNHCNRVRDQLAEDEKPVTLCPPELDPKCRFFWRIGDRPKKTKFVELNAEPVIPEGFPEWERVMNQRGSSLLSAVLAVAGMASAGLGLAPDHFPEMMNYGPHLLAPTGSNLAKYGSLNQVLAGYHYDLNFLTIHDRSRFPGLFVWTRQGKRIPVKVPPGCLLVQAGKQAEYLTGGYILAGFHEVIVSEATVKTIEKRAAEGQSLWRVSSTLFSHIQSDHVLEPLAVRDHIPNKDAFPPILTGDFVQEELRQINLAQH